MHCLHLGKSHKLSFLTGTFLRTSTLPSFPTLLPSNTHLFHHHHQHQHHARTRRLLSVFASKPPNPVNHAHTLTMRTNDYPSAPVLSDDDRRLGTPSLEILKFKLEELGIDTHDCLPGQYNQLLCPMCNGGDTEEKSLSLFISQDGLKALWTCFQVKCGWKGTTQAHGGKRSSLKQIKTVREITEQSLQLEPLCDELRGYFAERLIRPETLERNHVMQKRFVDEICIAFTYHRNGKLVNCKYRNVEKKFSQMPNSSWRSHMLIGHLTLTCTFLLEPTIYEKDAEKVFYGLDDIVGATDIIIVEGEIDKLSMEEAGFLNCVSVPDGAPATVSKKDLPPEEQDTKYQYLWNCKELLKEASRIILATDGDQPGQALAEELARRLGRERCWRVKWPKKNGVDHFKDANEVLMYLGPDVLREVVENAELYPIKGLFNFRDYFDEIDSYYHRSLGNEFGISTGWKNLDNLYNVVPGELTVVTGVPNSGKSEWIDALICNINEHAGWTFALCSMENKVREHARKLLEKHLKKPFFEASYGGFSDRMTVEELTQGKKWLSDTFSLIRCENDSLPSINWVLDLAKAAVLRHGVRGLVIDPYNELDHQRPVSQTETEYVSQMLTKIKRFAQHHGCHVWFVAHPRQLQSWNGGPPNLYDISGSAHFINKCDNGIVIHRNRDPEAGPIDRVQVCVRKVRNKVAGTVGDAFLSYNRVTGEYEDIC